MQVSQGRAIRRSHSTSSKGKTAIPTSNSLRTLTCLWSFGSLVGGKWVGLGGDGERVYTPIHQGYNLAALSLTSVAPCGSLLTSHPCRLYHPH